MTGEILVITCQSQKKHNQNWLEFMVFSAFTRRENIYMTGEILIIVGIMFI